MSSSFRLLDLPFIPLKEVCKDWYISDLLEISNDPMFFRVIGVKSEGFNMELNRFGWSIWTVKSWKCIGSNNGPDAKAEQMLTKLAKARRALPGKVDTFTVCTTLVKELCGSAENLPEDVDILIFTSEIDSHGREFATEDPNHYSWYWEPESEEVMEQREKSQKEEKIHMEKLIKAVKINKGIVLQGAGRPKSEMAFQMEFLRVEYSDWITPETLRTLQNRIVYLDRTDLSNVEMNDFLKDFQAGKVCPRLEILTIEGYEQDEFWDEQLVMKDVGAKIESNERLFFKEQFSRSVGDKFLLREAHYYFDRGIDVSEGFKFVRSDGRPCYVMFRDRLMTLYAMEDESPEDKRARC